MIYRRWKRPSLLAAAAALSLCLPACDQLTVRQRESALSQGQQRQAAGDFNGAVARYEAALDGTGKTAEAHFRLALLYSDKMGEPLSAVHHLRRYLELAPKGTYAREAKALLDRTEMTLATNLAGGTLLSHTDAMRLKNENAELHRQLAERNSGSAAPPPLSTPSKHNPAIPHTYLVQKGDTFASISRKIYKNKGREKDIQDANLNAIPDPKKLRAGMTIILP